MAKFVISPHFRLHEWVAEEKGYFRAEGLDYEFRNVFETHAVPDKVGAHTSFAKGRDTNVSCACHWTVNVAASQGHGKLYADAYSVSPAAVFVPPESPIKEPRELAGVPISVGHQSGSHYSTIQALEQYLQARGDQALLRRRHPVRPPGKADRPPGAGGGPVQRAVLLPRAARLPQDHRHHLHDGLDDHRQPRPGGREEILPRPAQRAARHRPAARALHALLPQGIPGALPRPDGHAPLGPGRAHRVRALHARDASRTPSSGSPSTRSSTRRRWGRAATKTRWSPPRPGRWRSRSDRLRRVGRHGRAHVPQPRPQVGPQRRRLGPAPRSRSNGSSPTVSSRRVRSLNFPVDLN